MNLFSRLIFELVIYIKQNIKHTQYIPIFNAVSLSSSYEILLHSPDFSARTAWYHSNAIKQMKFALSSIEDFTKFDMHGPVSCSEEMWKRN